MRKCFYCYYYYIYIFYKISNCEREFLENVLTIRNTSLKINVALMRIIYIRLYVSIVRCVSERLVKHI